ncbi:DUF7507 domain-containing protein [Sinorhizobium meliloti]|uniref:DUF7507 domain-containing protein n=1 Tax=Rhizobium meliloti TaxID=382 RepID=UPI0003615C6D|nr:DUF11 domain-containing protein [Sinorhizobium meliloti]
MAGAGTASNLNSFSNVATFIEPDFPSNGLVGNSCIEGSNGYVSRLQFNKPLIAPIFHFYNLDASRLAVTGTSTSGAAIGLTTVVKNNVMDVSGTTLNNTLQPATQNGCNNNSATDPVNGACGSFRLTAASGLIQTLTLNNNATPPTGTTTGFNDGLAWTLSFPTAPLTKQFSPASIAAGETSQLIFSITNPNQSGSVTLTPLDFTDNLPVGLTLASGTATNNGSCGSPTVTNGAGGALATGATSVRAANISVAPGATCTITVSVTATAVGNYTNGASNMSSSVGNLVPSGSATLSVDTQPSFGACTSTMYLAQNQPTALYRFDMSSNPIAVQPVGTTSPYNYNAVAFNSRDNYLYAISSSNGLLRIGSDGSVADLGAVTNLPQVAGRSYNAGEIGPDGSYYVRTQVVSNELYRIDLNTKTATSVPLSQALSIADLAWHDGLLYTVDNQNFTTTLYAINPSSGQVTPVGPTGQTTALFGALFGASNGLYGGNNSGGFYQFDLATGAAALISGLPGSGNNDGAKCVNSPMEFPVDLAITKDDQTTTYLPGGDATYTIVVSNNGPFGVQNAAVSDPLPAGITNASWTCGNATGGATCDVPSGTGAIDTTADLPAGGSVTYTLSMTVPASYSGSLTNTATVTAPEGSPDSDTSNNTASDTDTMEPPPVSGVCSPRLVTAGNSFTLSPFPVTGTVTKAGSAWQTDNPWATQGGGNYDFTWTFSQAVPASWIRFHVNDLNGAYTAQSPATVTVSLGTGSTASVSSFTKVGGDLAWTSGALQYNPSGPYRQSGYLQGSGSGLVTSITLRARGIASGDNIANSLYVRPPCLTVSKVSEDDTGSFQINMSNVATANGSLVGSTMLTTTQAGTAVSSPMYFARDTRTDVTLSEVVPAGWTLGSAVCTDQNAGTTGNPTVIGAFSSPAMTIPAANVRPQADMRCVFTNTPGEPQVSVKKELTGESVTTNNVAEPGEVLTYRVTVTHVSGSAFNDFEFIENIPNGATMTRVSGATGFTSPVAGASTVLLTVPEVPVGGEAVVEIDLTVAAPLPLGVTQIRNMVSGGDVPEDCPECSVTTPTPPYTPAYPPTVSCSTTGAYFNTAYNGSGGRKTSGFDDYWQVALTPTPVNGAPPAGLTWGGATIVTNPPGVYIPSPFGNAGWISHNASATHPDTTRNYDIFYRYQFNLDPAVEPSSLDLDMTFYSDNSVYQVWVNGQAQGIRSNYGGADPYFYAGFTASGGATGSLNGSWRTGLNEVIVHVKSGPGAQAFMAQINTPAICQPKVTLRKVVVNDNGGTAAAADFTLRATGQAPLTNVLEGAMGDAAVTNASIPSGTYALGEDNLAGYVADAYSCSVDGGAAAPAANNQLTLANGQNAICTVTNDDQDPQLTIEKTGTLNDLDGDGLIDLGETISYSFVVANTGNVSMTGVTVDDPLLTNAGISVTPGPQTLAPGGTATFTATYTPTQADIDAGRVENTATGTGTPPSGPPVESPPDTVIVPPEQTPRLSIEKTGTLNDSDGDGLLDPGETINFSFRVQNTGTLTMTGVTVNDPMLTNAGISVTPGPQTLAPGGTATFTATYAPTQAEIDAGEVENTATATGTPPSGPPTESPPDTVIVPPDQAPRLSIEKTGRLNDADGDGFIDLGETISYSFRVQNTGPVTMTNVTVNDSLLQGAGISVTPGPQTLAPGGTATFTATYTPTQADIDAGRVANTATGTGTPPSGPPIDSPPDTVVVPPEQTPRLSIEKTGTLNDGDGDGLIDLGETISYSFRVQNTGTVTLTGVTVNDPLLTDAGISVTPGPQTLAPGGTATFTATYTPTQGDIDAGRVENTATGTGTPPSGPPTESPPDAVVVPPDQTSGLTIEKTGTLNDGDGDDLIDLGETISYSFLVRNTGAVTLTGVTVNDPLLADAGITLDQGPQTLAPGATFTFTATYTPTQGDIDAGRVENTATGTGTPPSGPPIDSPPDTVMVPPDQTSALTIEKTGTLNDLDGDGLIDLGETISYAFRVQNTGTVTMTGVTVNDPLLTNAGISVTPGPQTLGPGGTATFTATYTPTQGDIDAGRVENTATGTGTPPSGPPIDSPPDTVIVPPDQAPALTIEKTGTLNDSDGDGLLDPGETISYSFLVRNTGTVTMTNVTVDDPLLANAGLSVTPGPQTLAPRGSVTFTATYAPTQGEIDAGRVENTATGTGTPPSGPPVESPPDTVVVPPDQAPALTIEKAGRLNDSDGDGLLDAGETISYSFLVRNTGAVTLTNVTVNDPLLANAGLSVTPGPQTLAPRGSVTFTATYAPTQAEIDAGRVENTATGTGTPPSGPPVESPPDTVVVPPDQASGLTIEKTGRLNDADGDGLLDAGETISYSFLVRNIGAVTMTNVTVNDPLLQNAGISVTPGPQTLAPRGSVTFTATYTPTQGEIDAGRVENTATGTGTPPSGPPVESPPDTVVVPPDQTSRLTIEKTGTLNDADGDGLLDAGETISYSFLVRNTGAVTMTNVTVNDPLLQNAGISVTPGPQTLAPGGTATFTATYAPTQAEIDAGRVENTATGTGTPPSGPPVESPPDTVVVPPDQTTGLTIEKTGTLNDADGDGLIDAGESIGYSFLVRNTGAVTMTNVTVNDPLLTRAGLSVTPGPQTLAPGGTATFTATYTPTQAEIDAGRVENTATGTGTPPSGPPVESPPDTVVVPPDQASGLTIEKTGTLDDADGDGLLDAGETISYSFLVRNTGAVTMTDVTVNDPLLANAGLSVTPGPQTLAPGGTATFTATYTPTQAEIDAGRVENTATGTGTPPSGPPTESPPDTIVVPPDQATGMTIEKTAVLNDLDGDDLLDLGESITYSFLVENTGAVTLTGVTVDDPMLARAGISLDQGPQTLAPAQTFTFTANYQPTQGEIDAGRVENTATATGTDPDGTPIGSPPDTVVTLPEPASLVLQKTGLFSDVDGNGYASTGDTLTYTFSVTNDGGQTVTNVWPVDAGPTFNGKAAGGSLSRFSPEPVTLAPGESQDFKATYTLTERDIENAAGVREAVANSATAAGTAGGGDVTSEESTSVVTMPTAEPTSITVTKVANLRFIRRGEQAPFTIRVINSAAARASGLTIVDTMPAGFRYVDGTATVGGTKVTPEIVGRQIRFPDVSVDGNSEIEIRLRLLALSTAGPGEHVNLAHAEDATGDRISGQARAVVEIIVEPVFDCGDIIGKVFDDENRNGYQDKGEPGLPGVRVATVKGWLITTDEYGRFHVACADLPEARIGSNFIMKLDTRTLPTGYRVTTENPRVVRLTAGKMTELNFGASIGRVVRLDLTEEAFVPGDVELAKLWAEGVDQLIDVLAEEQSVLRLTYLDPGSDPELAEARVKRTKALIAERWRQRKRSYPLEIETRVEAGQ